MKCTSIFVAVVLFHCLACTAVFADSSKSMTEAVKQVPALSLITETPEQGFQLAIALSRKAVKATQPNKEILVKLRDVYSKNADSLIAVSQVVAIHFQTVAAANNYWRDKK